MQKSDLNTALLFLVFNRPSCTQKVFDVIKKVKPKKLYVACDGARNKIESRLVNEVKEIIKNITWPCELKTLFRNNNLGCKMAVSNAIDWFFEHEEKGIILEDDCLPHIDFFYFCEELLIKYKNNPEISIINGTNFQDGNKRGSYSYYFSNIIHIWGWATWRRVWKDYDYKMLFWPKWKLTEEWKEKFPNFIERKYHEEIFDEVYEEKIDTWDYQLHAHVLKMNGLNITPNVNLVSNIGFGSNATHTFVVDKNSNMASYEIAPLVHPNKIIRNIKADKYEFNRNCGNVRWIYSKFKKFIVKLKIYQIVKKLINKAFTR